jgi:hypothetical protein
MKTHETKAGIVARGVLGILASVALTAGAAVGIAAELQRGFQPVFEAVADRQPNLRSPSAAARAAPRDFATAEVARAAGLLSHGG